MKAALRIPYESFAPALRPVVSNQSVDVRSGGLVQDMIWIAVTLAFFALSIAYVRFCERMK